MAITIETKRSEFYRELSDEKRKEYFTLKEKKFLPTVDNLYYGVFLKGDEKENPRIEPLIERLTELKAIALVKFESVPFAYGLDLTVKSYSFYRFCLTEQDLFDIFILSGKLPNEKTPRIVVQLRAMGLWTRGVETVLLNSFDRVCKVLEEYGFEVDGTRENRIDYCYHTNIFAAPDVMFREDRRGTIKNLFTNLSDANIHAKLEHAENGTIFHKDYICLGTKKANNVRARVYDKVKEVIEMGYKGFFFELWRGNGLISFYDKWCFEYALPHKRVRYLDRARLEFYLEFGENKQVKREFELTLADKNATWEDVKRLADSYMPKTTAITNIEYETKRKFYYRSDRFIDGFKTLPRENFPAALSRIFKILDNKSVFLDYLTSKTLSFHGKPFDDGEVKYLQWWERLRNTKLGGIKADEKLLREYAYEMDKKIIAVRTINNVASAAVYDDNLDTDFVEDVSDLLSSLNDNDAHQMGVLQFMDEDGEFIEHIDSKLLRFYQTTKDKKDKVLKNRKKRANEREKAAIKGVEGAKPEDKF